MAEKEKIRKLLVRILQYRITAGIVGGRIGVMIIHGQKRVKKKRLQVDNKEMGYLLHTVMLMTIYE